MKLNIIKQDKALTIFEIENKYYVCYQNSKLGQVTSLSRKYFASNTENGVKYVSSPMSKKQALSLFTKYGGV